MNFSAEWIISITAIVLTFLLLVFAVDWRFFRDWVVVYLFKTNLDLLVGSVVVEKQLIHYPYRFAGFLYDTSLLFEVFVFPVLCILYNQVTREHGLLPVFYYALLFSAGITAVEYVLERHTGLITYLNWSWYYTFASLVAAFLVSRAFIALFRYGCRHFG